MRVTVSRSVEFDSAHYLPGYSGKCSRVHGHRWKVEIGVNGPINRETGMVIDFHDLEGFLQRNILNLLDHCCLNDLSSDPEGLQPILSPPTAEVITEYIWEQLRGYIGKLDLDIRREFVKVWESPDSCAEIRREAE